MQKTIIALTAFLILSASGCSASPSSWEQLEQKCDEQLQSGNYDSAEQSANQLMQLAKTDNAAFFKVPLARNILARAMYLNKKNSQSLKEIEQGLKETQAITANTDVRLSAVGKTLERGFYMQKGIVFSRMKDFAKSEEAFGEGMKLGVGDDPPYASFLEYYAGLCKLKGDMKKSSELLRTAGQIRVKSGETEHSLDGVLREMDPQNAIAKDIMELNSKVQSQETTDPQQLSIITAEVVTLNKNKLKAWHPTRGFVSTLPDNTVLRQVVYANESVNQEISINSMQPKLGFGARLGADSVQKMSESSGLVPVFDSVDQRGTLSLAGQPLYFYTGNVTIPGGPAVKGFTSCIEPPTSKKTVMIFGFDTACGAKTYTLPPTKEFIDAIDGI